MQDFNIEKALSSLEVEIVLIERDISTIINSVIILLSMI